MTPALEFKNVTGGYRHHGVFDNLTFEVGEGSLSAVIGPNGSGKTSLLRAATGLLERCSGTVRLFGRDVTSMPAQERAAMVGVVPQFLETPMAFTVEEIVTMGRTRFLRRWHRPSESDRHMIEQAMVYTDVADMRERPFPDLSGGEQQRVIIAMVVAQQPRVVLMDEATSHLDINHRLEIMQLVERLNRERGVTVMLVSHDLNMAAEFCERLLLLDRGRIVADGTPTEVLTEQTLRHVYNCDVRIRQDGPTGTVSVVPAPRLAPGRTGKGIHVHVIAGGGCGEEVLRRLNLCGYTVSCGALNRGDSDAEVAEALELSAALEAPFSPLGAHALDAARKLAEQAHAVVICGVPFGPGNVANLDLAEGALAQGKPVLMMAGTETRDYTPAKEATVKAARLERGGAALWNSVTDLLELLPSGTA